MSKRPPKGWSITMGEFLFLLAVTAVAFLIFPYACALVPHWPRPATALVVFLPWAASMAVLFTRHDRRQFRIALAMLVLVVIGTVVLFMSARGAEPLAG